MCINVNKITVQKVVSENKSAGIVGTYRIIYIAFGEFYLLFLI